MKRNNSGNDMWNRKLWGIEFLSNRNEKSIIIGGGWDRIKTIYQPGEPTRALLFTTRLGARKWCDAKMAVYAGRSDTCSQWLFRPVRVTEVVKKDLRQTSQVRTPLPRPKGKAH